MARIRSIKPEFWSSEQIVELSPIARLLFIGLWNFCDDGGNHPASARTLKMEVFPGDDFTADQITAWIEEMKKCGLIIEYQADNRTYWHVTGWHHQKIEKPNYKHPAPKFDDHSPTARRPFDPGRESKGKERKGKEGSVSNARAREDEISNQKNPHPPINGTGEQTTGGPPDTPLPDQLHDQIAAWVETDRGIEILKTWKRDTGYSDRAYGPTTAELRKFIAYHLGKPAQRDRFINDPVTYFTEQFPGWLANATQFNRPQPDRHTPRSTGRSPQRGNGNATPVTTIGDIAGKIITTIGTDA